jgi:hypothetical protein
LATGDGVFSVGISQACSITLSSSSNIIGHKTFQEEYLAFLKKHGAQFDEKYLWDELRRSYRTLRDGFFEGRFPTLCLATISLALGTKSHSPIEGPRIKLALMG